MNNKLTILSVIIAHLCVITGLVFVGGCRSSSGMEGEPNRRAFSGFPGESGASGYEAGTGYSKPAATAAVAQPAVVINPPSAVTVNEPAAAPGYENNTPAPAAVAAAAEPAPAAIAEPTTVAAPVGTGRTYTVKPNESLWIIAKREGVSIDDIVAANHLNKNSVLRPGQKLTIPAASGRKSVASSAHTASAKAESTVAVSGDTYVVKSGDAISLIARKLGTTSAALREANGLTGDNIHVGQKLKVPAAARNKTAGTAVASAESKKTVAAPAAESKGTAPAPVAAPASGGLRDIPLMGAGVAPAAVAAPESGAAVAAPAPEAVEATPVSR